jgi:hypothetical protein
VKLLLMWKVISCTYSDCGSIGCCNEYSRRIHRTILSGVSCLEPKILFYYLINEAIFRIVDIEYRVIFISFLNFRSEKFIYLKIIPRDDIINKLLSLFKIHTILVRFWDKFRILHRFCTRLQISIIFLRIDGQPSRNPILSCR